MKKLLFLFLALAGVLRADIYSDLAAVMAARPSGNLVTPRDHAFLTETPERVALVNAVINSVLPGTAPCAEQQTVILDDTSWKFWQLAAGAYIKANPSLTQAQRRDLTIRAGHWWGLTQVATQADYDLWKADGWVVGTHELPPFARVALAIVFKDEDYVFPSVDVGGFASAGTADAYIRWIGRRTSQLSDQAAYDLLLVELRRFEGAVGGNELKRIRQTLQDRATVRYAAILREKRLQSTTP